MFKKAFVSVTILIMILALASVSVSAQTGVDKRKPTPSPTPSTSASIGDYIWWDRDGDGEQNETEAGLAEVTVQLMTPGDDEVFGTEDDVEVATVTTDADGTYDFTDLEAGIYQVNVTDTGGVLSDLSLTTDNEPLEVTLSESNDYNDADFGYEGAPPPIIIPDTGELYGDLYIILRDENGVPILHSETLEVPASEEDPAGTEVVKCIQPISAVTASVTIDTYDGGTFTVDAFEGEPFALPSYVDPLGDLVACELTEEMADWVQAVDFGRLNLGRAPDAVIAHAFDEAVNKLNMATDIKLDPAGRLVLTLPDAETGELIDKTIDAPAENLALYIKMMIDGHWITTDTDPVEHGGGGGSGGGPPEGKGSPDGDGPSTEPRPVLNCDNGILASIGLGGLCVSTRTNADLNNQELLQAASLLAAAADKTGNFTLDKVVYINSIYGINQAGTLPGEIEGKTYFDFRNRYVVDSVNSPYLQDRGGTYGNRSSGTCTDDIGFGPGWIEVLQPYQGSFTSFTVQCVEILGYENNGHNPEIAGVHFTDLVEGYETVFDENGDPLVFDFIDNVRGFAQAVDDALQVIEYIHNYKIPVDLYAP